MLMERKGDIAFENLLKRLRFTWLAPIQAPGPPLRESLRMEGQARLSSCGGQETARRAGPRRWGKWDAARPRRTSMLGIKLS